MPSKSRPDIPAPLESICMKCLAKVPSQRYASAKELSQDLERFLRSEPILARSAGVGQRIVRWGRRHPALAAHLMAITPTLFTVQTNYWLSDADSSYHMRNSIVLTVWMTAAVFLQNWLERPRWRFAAAATWCITDTVFLSILLYLVRQPVGPLLVGYALLIVACGFLLRTSLVVVTTATAIVCYLVLLYLCPEMAVRPDYCVLFVLMLAVLGGTVAAQVNRISQLNQYFQAVAD